MVVENQVHPISRLPSFSLSELMSHHQKNPLDVTLILDYNDLNDPIILGDNFKKEAGCHAIEESYWGSAPWLWERR
jgi:hypothetical protein